LERLSFAVTYTIFLFFWDDNIDRGDSSYELELANSIELGNRYRAEAKAYVDYHLGFAPKGSQEPVYHNPQLEMFARCAEMLRRGADQDTIRRFRDEVLFYIDCCQQEQEDRLTGRMPNVEEYWKIRLGASSVFTYCAITP
jgi:hypothetical protein